MKTTGFSIKSILVICALSLSSCEGFFDLAPKDGLNDKLFWNNVNERIHLVEGACIEA